MDLINNDHVNHLHHTIGLTCDNIPLLRCWHNNVSLLYLLLAHVHISCKLTNLDLQISQSCRELSNDFWCQCLKWCYINDLELFEWHVPVGRVIINMVTHFTQDSKHCNVSFTSTSWSWNQQTALAFESLWEYLGLDYIEMFGTTECFLSPGRQISDWYKVLYTNRVLWRWYYLDILVIIRLSLMNSIVVFHCLSFKDLGSTNFSLLFMINHILTPLLWLLKVALLNSYPLVLIYEVFIETQLQKDIVVIELKVFHLRVLLALTTMLLAALPSLLDCNCDWGARRRYEIHILTLVVCWLWLHLQLFVDWLALFFDDVSLFDKFAKQLKVMIAYQIQ